MPGNFRVAYFAHSIRSDWNNGNAHFLRGLLRGMTGLGHDVTIFEPETEWSIENLQTEPRGEGSLAKFLETYSDLDIQTYSPEDTAELWHERLLGTQIVILHEWNSPALAQSLLALRERLNFRLLFHDTHHRASSSPEQMQSFGLTRFDGVLAFGQALHDIYRERFGLAHVWTLHEAADISVFHPQPSERGKPVAKENDVVWVGNWGDGERSAEIDRFLLQPAAALAPEKRFTVYGVRYPEAGLKALDAAHVVYGGYLPNLDAPTVYAASRLTVHIPRQQYSSAMTGIPTIRVFEALACGIPLISAPWQDTENLFRPGDYAVASTTAEMVSAMRALLDDPELAAAQARQGLQTVLARHTCVHRAQELTHICEELLA
jgi:spore maturation protein CgeB